MSKVYVEVKGSLSSFCPPLDTNLGSVPDAVHRVVGEHKVGGGANDGSHEGGGGGY